MTGKAQHRRAAVGIARFEIAALPRDKDLLRRLARRLAETGSEAEGLRAELDRIVAGEAPGGRGGIWRALRASPLVGAELELERSADPGRDVEL